MKEIMKFDRKKFKMYIEKTAANYGVSVVLILLLEVLARHSFLKGFQFVWDHPFLVLYSALILTSVYSVAFLFRRRRFVWILFTVLFLMLGIANCILLFFRITPLSATDIAMVTSVYEIMQIYLSVWQIVLLLLVLLGAIAALVFLGAGTKPQERNFAAAGSVVAVLFLSTAALMKIGDATGMLQTDFANLPDAYEDNGYVYCFTRSIVDRGIEKPEEYTEEVLEDIFSDIRKQKDKEVENRPNLIFLQIESFFDLSRVIGAEYSEEPMPVYRDLLDTCSGGKLTVPSVGAGTANTEFEVLTGMNIDYFGAGEYPYNTILQEETCESMAYNLKKLGYKTTAIHNNTGTFYDRNKVYPNLGFDRFDCEEYMNGLTYNQLGWANDRILTQQIVLALTSTKEQDFVYAVSVQPHGKYPEEAMENPHIVVTGFAAQEQERANGFEYYVNEVHETDAFLGMLISTLNALDEPTVVVMFGDHLPNIDFTEEEISDGGLFETEYLIWANRAQREKKKMKNTKKDLCAYQLYAYVFGRLGMNQGVLTKFHQRNFLDRAYESELETLMYDMLYGDREIYGGINPHKPTQIQMGLVPVRITHANVIAGSLYVHGENFTEYSKVSVNGKEQETIYLNRNTLMVADMIPEDMDRISVVQLTEINEYLGETQEIVYED